MISSSQAHAHENGRGFPEAAGGHDYRRPDKPGSLVEVDLALERSEVTFPTVMRARYLGGQVLYQRTLEAFASRYGGIRECVYAEEFAAGAILTEQHELFFAVWWDEFEIDTRWVRKLEAKISDLRMRAMQYLPPASRRNCMQRLLRIYTGLIWSLQRAWHRWPAESPELARDLRLLRRELAVAARRYRLEATQGKRRYVEGAAGGALIITAVAGVVAWIVGAADHTIWLGTLASGAAGALLSVLERQSRGALTIHFEADWVLLNGIYRPVVGALSALALFALVEGGIVPLDAPADRGLFFAGLGVLAGFTERFATGVLDSAAGTLRRDPGERRGAANGAPARVR